MENRLWEDLKDLQTLDAEDPPPVDVVGKAVPLGEDGHPFPGVVPGPFVRLTGVHEWSVEYDELTVIVWVSTETASHKPQCGT